MGITIRYKGKEKSLEAIDALIQELQELSQMFGRGRGLVEEEVQGELSPSWGYGFGYLPSKEQMEKEGIEYSPAMVSKDCNGYFKLWESKYKEDYRKAFKKGVAQVFGGYQDKGNTPRHPSEMRDSSIHLRPRHTRTLRLRAIRAYSTPRSLL